LAKKRLEKEMQEAAAKIEQAWKNKSKKPIQDSVDLLEAKKAFG